MTSYYFNCALFLLSLIPITSTHYHEPRVVECGPFWFIFCWFVAAQTAIYYWLMTFQSKHIGICNWSFNDALYFFTRKKATSKNGNPSDRETSYDFWYFKVQTGHSGSLYLSVEHTRCATYHIPILNGHRSAMTIITITITIHRFNSIQFEWWQPKVHLEFIKLK